MVGNGTSPNNRILKQFVNPNHPVCAAKERDLFLMAQPPLLYQEGSCLTFIHSFIDRGNGP